ncbi:MAG: sigma 54-interacting transcriptional regulator, partial [Bacteriovoracaceae bacterium]
KRDPLASTGIRSEKIEAELCIPVMFESSVIGTINVQSEDANRQFSESDITVINNILSDLAAPIKNMHLFLMTKNLNRELLGRIEAKEKELSNRVEIKTVSHFEDKSQMVGVSKSFLTIVQAAKKVASQDFPVLLEGAHGTGKKLLAKKIHAWSNRKGGCVIANCSVLNETQLDRELFSSKGLMVQANGGTLIMDDIGSISVLIQTKLLRAIVSGEMTTVDTDEKIALNVRIVATSKTSLREQVEAGNFKEDLFYRLNTIALTVPSLKDRAEDIKVMAEFFLNNGKSEAKILTSAAIEKLNDYFWPGNAHELKNIMERTYILSEGQYIEASELPDFPREEKVEVEEAPVKFSESTLYDLEKKHIIDTLDHLSGNKTRAAKALGITVKTLYNKLHSYGLIETREA